MKERLDSTGFIAQELREKRSIFTDFSITLFPLIVFSCLCLLNLVLYDSPWILLLTIPQIIFVFYQLFVKGLDYAVFWHFMFIITGLEATTANVGNLAEITMLSYLRLKIIGPVGLAYFLSIFLLFCALISKKKILKKGLFYQLFLFLSFLFVIGGIFSCIGMLLQHHDLGQFLEYNIYLGMVCCNMFLLLHTMTPYMKKTLFPALLTLLAASPIATLLSWKVFHKVTEYSGFEAALQSQIDFFSPCLLLFLLYPMKGKFYFLLGLLSMVCNLAFSGGGSELLIFGVFFVIFTCICFFKRSGYYCLKAAIIICIVVIGSIVINILLTLDSSSLFALKMREVISLFSVFSANSLSDIHNYIPHSPYVRISEILNILYCGLKQPIFLFFGQGPGGYFEDHLNMFHFIELGKSDYNLNAISSGKFSYAHGAIPCVTLLNGLVGIVGLGYFTIRYLLKSEKFPLAATAFIWLGMSFYFNMQTAIICMLLLFCYDLFFILEQDKKIEEVQ